MKFDKEAGQVSKLLLILAVIVLVAAVIAYIVIKAAEKPVQPVVPVEEVPVAVYEATIGDVKFTFESAKDMGKTLFASQSNNPNWEDNLTTTEKFIKVTVGAQNLGSGYIRANVWDLGNIIDSEGRNYEPLTDNKVGSWLPEDNLCGSLLKPAFAPTSCVKIYEVAKISTGLKIQVMASVKSGSGEYSTNDADKKIEIIDLIVTK